MSDKNKNWEERLREEFWSYVAEKVDLSLLCLNDMSKVNNWLDNTSNKIRQRQKEEILEWAEENKTNIVAPDSLGHTAVMEVITLQSLKEKLK